MEKVTSASAPAPKAEVSAQHDAGRSIESETFQSGSDFAVQARDQLHQEQVVVGNPSAFVVERALEAQYLAGQISKEALFYTLRNHNNLVLDQAVRDGHQSVARGVGYAEVPHLPVPAPEMLISAKAEPLVSRSSEHRGDQVIRKQLAQAFQRAQQEGEARTRVWLATRQNEIEAETTEAHADALTKELTHDQVSHLRGVNNSLNEDGLDSLQRNEGITAKIRRKINTIINTGRKPHAPLAPVELRATQDLNEEGPPVLAPL